MGALFGCLWTVLGLAVGGVDASLIALFWLVMLDFSTGMCAGWYTKTWSSKIGCKGLLKKASIFVAVMIGYAVDTTMHTDMLRTMFIAGFGIIEALSVIENLDRCGMGDLIPSFVREKLQQIKKEKKV